MGNQTKNLETIVDFVPDRYGTVFKIGFTVFDFAQPFGKTDPLDYAVARLQEQINALVAAFDEVHRPLNISSRSVAKIENDRHVDGILTLNREATRIAFQISQTPTDAKVRLRLAFDARALADEFLQERDFWE
jgi:hypothetical protein